MMTRMLEQLPAPVKAEIQKMIGKKKIEDLSAEERGKVFAKMRELTGGGGGGRPAAGPTEAERANAKLPLPPEEESQLDVLLRPGLLADVEIIVEKISNGIHIPNQAVFEKEGKQFVYVQTANRFEQRFIKPAKRSESVLVVAEGLKAGEVIALADPTAKKGSEKKGDKGAGGAPKSMGGMPGGK